MHRFMYFLLGQFYIPRLDRKICQVAIGNRFDKFATTGQNSLNEKAD